MNAATAYLHVLDGRARIKVREVKGSPDEACALERRLAGLHGVSRATANPLTGNVLVLYDGDQIAVGDIMNALWGWGYLREPQPASGALRSTGDGFGAVILRATTEFAIQHLITALI